MSLNLANLKFWEERYKKSRRSGGSRKSGTRDLGPKALRKLYLSLNAEVWALLDGASLAYELINTKVLKKRQEGWERKIQTLKVYKAIYSDFIELFSLYSGVVKSVYSKRLEAKKTISRKTKVTRQDPSVCKLSVVVTTRNDDHGKKLHERTVLFLRTLASQAKRFALDLELVVVEWNPPKAKVSFEERYRALLQEFLLHKVVSVAPEVHARLEGKARYPLYQMIAKNVGIRKSRGEYILCTNIDVILSDDLVRFLANGSLSSGSLYRTQRFDCKDTAYELLSFPPQVAPRLLLSHTYRINTGRGCTNLPNINDQQNPTRWGLRQVRLGERSRRLSTNACGDFQLMSRQDWENVRGYPEWDSFSMHLDSVLEVQADMAGIKEVLLPPPLNIFHIDHESGWSSESEKSGAFSALIKEKGIRTIRYEEFHSLAILMELNIARKTINNENWGLLDGFSHLTSDLSTLVSDLPNDSEFPKLYKPGKEIERIRRQKAEVDLNYRNEYLINLAEVLRDWTLKLDAPLMFWGLSERGRDLAGILLQLYNAFFNDRFLGFIDIDNKLWGKEVKCEMSRKISTFLRNNRRVSIKYPTRGVSSPQVYPPTVVEGAAFRPAILITCGDDITPYRYLEERFNYDSNKIMIL